MTLYIPLDASNGHPNSPSFLVPSASPEAHLATVIEAILKAKRIAVVCGAGISVEAGIPDFRSQDGLFQSLKRDNPKEALSSGKDLFDTSVFKSTQKIALFYRMIARLSSLSSQGQPTAFHQFLRVLDDRGQLLRVYTQNIDALEMKAGLSFGVPIFDEKILRVKLKGKARAKAKESGSGAYSAKLGSRRGTRPPGALASNPPSTLADELDTPGAGPSMPPQPIPIEGGRRLNVIPRCIPLHGTLLTLHCPHCTQSFPLHAPSSHPSTLSPPPSPNLSPVDATTSLHSMLAHGTPPPCPSCTSLEETRALVGKRLRGVGKLRPSVVLYGEEHREGEGVGEVVRRDLCGITDVKTAPAAPGESEATTSPSKSRARAGKGPDLLLVVGTSLRVPGTKRIVREFSKAVRPSTSPPPVQLPTPTSSPPATDTTPTQVRTVYLNLEFPAPAREWEGVFDVWLNGDAQTFAKVMHKVIGEEEAKAARKKPRSPSSAGTKSKDKNSASGGPKRKRKVVGDMPETPTRPAKKRKVGADLPLTPVSMPRASNGRFERKKKSDTTSPTKIRKVILRLPPPPSAPPLTRRGSIPEVVITTNRMILSSQRLCKRRSLSPLTPLSPSPSPSSSSLSSLSSLTPPPPLPPPPSELKSVDIWRKDLEGRKGSSFTLDGNLSEEEVPLAMIHAPRNAEVRYPAPPPAKYTYGTLEGR